MTPILYEKDEIDFTSQGLGSLVEIYDVDVQEQRNGLLQLTASYPVSGVRYADISVGRIILAKPNQRDDVHAFRIVSTELDISGYAVTIEADSITYDLTHNIVKHLNVSGNGQSFMTALKNAVVNPSIFEFYSDIATSSTTSLNYVNPMEAIMGTTGSFLQIWGGELKRENRRVAMFNRRGRDNVSTFRLGKNISGLKYSVNISSLVTRIIPTKSVQNDDQTTTTLEGTPVDSQYINNYEQIYTLPLEFTDDTIKTVADLNAAAKGWFTQSANTGRDKPTVTIDIDVLSLQDSADYQDKFKNLESVSLTDTVTVYVPEYGVNVTAIVNELHYDPILDKVTKMTVGTAKQSFADSSRNQLSDLQDKIISVQNQADAAAVSADGKSKNYYGSVEPSHPQEGDTWFWVDGDKSGIKVFVNGEWVEPVDSDTQEKIAAGVTEAVTQANAHTDEVKQGLSSDINTAKSQAASQASTAEANAKSAATSQFNQAKDALAQAKSNLQSDIDKNKGNIVEINQTLTGFDGTLQRVQDAVNGLGQTNQLMNTEFTPDLQSWENVSPLTITASVDNSNNYNGSNIINLVHGTNVQWSQFRQSVSNVIKGSAISLSVWAKATQSNSSVAIDSYDSSNTRTILATKTLTGTGAVVKFENITIPADSVGVYISFWSQTTGTISFSQPMLVFENTVGAYAQGNYNNNDAVAQVKLTADKASLDLSTYKIDADGRISKAQAGVEANAKEIIKKVSQTDYDKVTGDLSVKLNKTTDTADSTKQELSDYKEFANGNISGVSTDLEKLAGKVDLKLTKTDYDSDQSKLNTSLTQWKADYDGWTGTVSRLSDKVNNLGQTNQLLNTEFNPDLQSWEQNVGTSIISSVKVADTTIHEGSKVLWVVHTATTSWAAYRQPITGFVAGGKVSMSTWAWQSSGNWSFLLESYNSSGTRTVIKTQALTSTGTYIKFENLTIPSDAVTLYYSFWGQTAGTLVFSQPMLVFSSTVGTYVQGNYNNNAALAQVKITADSIDKFVRDSSGNISSDFQTALSKTSIITGSTLATSIQKQTATQITQAVTDNNKNIIAMINLDTSGVQIAGKNIVLNGDTTVTGAFKVSQANIANGAIGTAQIGDASITSAKIATIDAGKITTGVLNSITANSMTLNAGTINGAAIYVTSMQNQIDGTTQNVRLGINPNWQHQLHIEPVNQSSGWHHYLYAGNDHLFLGAWDGSNSNTYDNRVALFTEGGSSEVDVGTIRLRSSGSAIYDNGWGSIDGVTSISMKGSNPSYTSMYVGVGNNGTGEFRVVTNATIGTSNLNYADARAAHWYTSSLAKYKTNISEMEDGSALEMVNRAGIYKYQFKTDAEAGNDKYTFGPVIGADYLNNPIDFLDSLQEGTDDHSASWITMKALQEEDSKVEALIARIEELEEELESEGK